MNTESLALYVTAKLLVSTFDYYMPKGTDEHILL
jgi:hypothetical protein